jgi:thiamine pyrophosphokinase
MPAEGGTTVTVTIVLAGGDPVEPALRTRLPAADYVVAADSGLHAATALGLRVDHVVGDFDSVDPAAVDAAVAHGATLDRHPVAKDQTDLELAFHDAVAHDAHRIVMVGGHGGRLDHLLANVMLLTAPAFDDQLVEAHLGDARVTVVRGGKAEVTITGEPGSLVTLLPAGGPATGVVTEGLEYPLRDEDLPCGTSRGVSNVMLGETATVALGAGTLLAVQPTGGVR